MKLLILQDDLYDYLSYVIKNYANSGIDPEEGQALFFLNRAVKGAQSVDDKQVAKVQVSPDETQAQVSVEAGSGEGTQTPQAS